MARNRLLIRLIVSMFLTVLLLVSCNGEGTEFLGMPLTQATPVPTITPVPTVAIVTPIPEDTIPDGEDSDVKDTLLLWVPPLMDPANGTAAAALLQTKLDDFTEQNPSLEVIVRVKGETGAASLIESLNAVSAVAPLELPSLVVLGREDLESAAKTGLVLPMGDYSSVINEVDWFQYARSLSVIGDSSYGLPLVGDALVMVIRPAVEESEGEGEGDEAQEPVENMDQIGFWLNDPEYALLLNDYLSLGGELLDEENQVILNEKELTLVYAEIKEDYDAGLLFGGLSEITSHADAWERYKNGDLDIVVVPSSFALSGLPQGSTIIPLTALTDYDYTLAKGWTVALADPLPERRELAVALAESLTEVVFMGEWSEALGYLPVRDTAFEHWQNGADTQPLSLISFSAHIYPSREVIKVVSPALRAGISAILDDGATPEEAASIAMNTLTTED